MVRTLLFILWISGYGSADSACIQHFGNFPPLLSCGEGDGFIQSIRGIANPSYMALCADGQTAWVVSEMGVDNSSVNRIDLVTGDILQTFSTGYGPCYVALDTEERRVAVANYGDGTVDVFPLVEGVQEQHFAFSGSGPVPNRQAHSRCHCTAFTPDGRELLITDLGADRVYVFAVGADSLRQTGEVVLSPGSGPRHIVFRKDSQVGYLIEEIAGMVCVLKRSAKGWKIQQEMVCDSVHAQGSGDIRLSPDERFLYASNRLQRDGIAIYQVQKDGTLNPVGYQSTGRHPRCFCITPDGKWLLCACRDENAVEIYERDLQTGLLMDTEKRIPFSKPVWLYTMHDAQCTMHGEGARCTMKVHGSQCTMHGE